MRQCSEKAYAECKSPMRCKSREVAFYLPGSQCDDFNREKEKKVTNGDALRAMTDKALAEYLCGMTDCDPDICPGYLLCIPHSGKGNGLLKWLQKPAEKPEEDTT